MRTRFGREINPPSQKKTTSAAGLRNNAKSVDRWLLTEALRAAAINEDFHAVHLFAAIDQSKMAPADRTDLNLYLFGVEEIRL